MAKAHLGMGFSTDDFLELGEGRSTRQEYTTVWRVETGGWYLPARGRFRLWRWLERAHRAC